MSTERSYIGILMYNVSVPWEAASYMVSLFDQLSGDLSDHQSRAIEQEYYRAHLIRESRNLALSSISTPNRSSSSSSASTNIAGTDKHYVGRSTVTAKEIPTKTCAGHFGKQLKATYGDGRPYKCAFGKSCKFKHIGKVGKTREEVLAIIKALPTTAQDDLGRAVGKHV